MENQPLTKKVSKPRNRDVLYVDLTGRRGWVVQALKFLASQEKVDTSLAAITFKILASYILMKYGPSFILQFTKNNKKFNLVSLRRLLRC